MDGDCKIILVLLELQEAYLEIQRNNCFTLLISEQLANFNVQTSTFQLCGLCRNLGITQASKLLGENLSDAAMNNAAKFRMREREKNQNKILATLIANSK